MQPEKIAQLSIILLVVSCFGIVTNASANPRQENAREVLQLAEDVGRWLAGNAIETGNGIAWPDNTLSPETTGYDLGSGVAGNVVYFVALYRATGNADYLNMAKGGADYLIDVLQNP